MSRVLNEDPRLSETLGIEHSGGAILRYIRKQMASCLYEKKKVYKGQTFVNRWFLQMIEGNGIIKKEKYTKIKVSSSDVVQEISKSDTLYYDCKAHFKITLLRPIPSKKDFDKIV